MREGAVDCDPREGGVNSGSVGASVYNVGGCGRDRGPIVMVIRLAVVVA